jgi:DNA-binding response OmpR family regulator
VVCLQDLLLQQGYRVLTATSGESGIAAIGKSRSTVPFIFFAGLIDPAEKQTLLERGVMDVLSKPLDAQGLLKVIAKVIAKS